MDSTRCEVNMLNRYYINTHANKNGIFLIDYFCFFFFLMWFQSLELASETNITKETSFRENPSPSVLVALLVVITGTYWVLCLVDSGYELWLHSCLIIGKLYESISCIRGPALPNEGIRWKILCHLKSPSLETCRARVANKPALEACLFGVIKFLHTFMGMCLSHKCTYLM